MKQQDRTWINDKKVGTALPLIIANACKQEARSGVLIANDSNEVAALTRLDDTLRHICSLKSKQGRLKSVLNNSMPRQKGSNGLVCKQRLWMT